jgi:hypothetical protein
VLDEMSELSVARRDFAAEAAQDRTVTWY